MDVVLALRVSQAGGVAFAQIPRGQEKQRKCPFGRWLQRSRSKPGWWMEPQQAWVVDVPIHNSCTAEVVDGLLMFLRRRWASRPPVSLFADVRCAGERAELQADGHAAREGVRSPPLRTALLPEYQRINEGRK